MKNNINKEVPNNINNIINNINNIRNLSMGQMKKITSNLPDKKLIPK